MLNARAAKEIADRAVEVAAQMYMDEVCKAARMEAESGNYTLPAPLAVPEQYSKNKNIIAKVVHDLETQLHYEVQYDDEAKTLNVDWRNAK